MYKTTATTAQLEDWLKAHPADHPMRPTIEADLRNKLKEAQNERPIERDTFDLREHNFHNQ